MRLTAFSRFLIVAGLSVGVFFLVRTLLQPDGSVTPEESQVAPEEPADAPAEQAVSFDFLPPAPVDGTLKGIVELGASGFNSFIIRSDTRKNWKLEKAEFGASLVYERMATEEDVRAGLRQYIRGMLDYGVTPKAIHFMVSSSAALSPEVQQIRKGLKSLGYVVNEVSAAEEGRFAMEAALPRAYRNTGFSVDIGSGNTKITWVEDGKVESVETYGSKYFQKGITDLEVARQVGELAERVPVGQRDVCFIIGGAPYDLAKTHRNGKERYTVLKAPASYELEGEKARAGANIYGAIRQATGCNTFVFDWDANFTIGFLLSL